MRLLAALLLALGVAGAAAQEPVTQADTAAPDMAQRIWVASRIMSAVQMYFAYWEAVPGLDFEAEFRAYLDAVAQAADRREYSLANRRLLATLGNGHSFFYDQQLQGDAAGLGFSLQLIEGRWTVVDSLHADLQIGDVILLVNGQSIYEFYAELRPYLHGSSERERERRWSWSPEQWPQEFTLGLADDRNLNIVRGSAGGRAPSPAVEGEIRASGFGYLRIRSFAQADAEQQAIAWLQAHPQLPGLIIDVRGNGGGTTPASLIRALMDRPWREPISSSPQHFALYKAWAAIPEAFPEQDFGEQSNAMFNFAGGLVGLQVSTPASLQQPSEPLYSGPLVLLIDGACASACEGFLMPFAVTDRARLIGEPTLGSTGQPYVENLGDGMQIRISARRMRLGDGREFEGVGISPDQLISPGIEDLRNGADPVFDAALAWLAGQQAAAEQ